MTAPSNAATIAAFLKAHGLSSTAIAGVEGNLQVESGLSPTASNPNEGAIGLAQWEGGRRTALDAYAAKTGGSETNLQTQLGYLWQELSGPYSGALHNLEAATTPAQAATVWDTQYEMSAGTTRAARIADAQAFAAGSPNFGGNPTLTSSPGAQSALFGIPNPLNVGNDIASGLTSVIKSITHPIVTFLENILLVVFGLIVLIVGLVVLAHNAADSADAKDAPAAMSRGKGSKDAGEGEEAAEVAAA